MKTIDELQKEITAFRDARNWKQFHNPKDLAISISLEAAELLEVFQWSGKDVLVEEKRDRLEEELADVLIYCGLMADAVGMKIDEIILKKLEKNKKKYPVEKAYGNSAKYTELEDGTCEKDHFGPNEKVHE
ncbi:nucleotide pyrophosphohydrolase [Lacrimispora sp. 210928-DFI.3.58]|uniref:nucleotide pyrophosphohydrolase n=1 Tax=Lacrimispora sp. 210928-DFI.3.58 TaxID=2883214 RepID=UPI001D068B57|nr:nucleotide pyrophosphohydrolase [Lacrimispora sp. 210928-DFI.3.58]MCB7320819.1 nucleotide pyrophosphohydrolase [Lacrimispora sp. 210928-DFI.3.58]